MNNTHTIIIIRGMGTRRMMTIGLLKNMFVGTTSV